MLKRDLTLKLSTQARAPGFRVELHGTTFRLIASGAWTVAEAAKIDAALKRLRVPIPPTPEFTGEILQRREHDQPSTWIQSAIQNGIATADATASTVRYASTRRVSPSLQWDRSSPARRARA